ncbi:MAG: sodium:solute symporter [Pseudonocardiaceae bacterium]|nr:sodium:solute symporter [Pseudonocardiaceae bacterium]
MRTVDVVIIAGYLLAVPAAGLLLSGRQRGARDFFVSNRNLPWWAVCSAVVATETSTLTVISVPTVAYLGSFTYLQLALGYLLGRVVVAFVLLPRYYGGELVTAYAYLGRRFGSGLQSLASATFLVTRLLADGVRLFATAIPVKVMAEALGLQVAYWQIVGVITIVTVLYTYLGGTRAVIWIDALQLLLYLGGALVAVVVLATALPDGWFGTLADAGKLQLVDFSSDVVTEPYAFLTAVVGGAMLSMASHGADQLIVQRLLACRTLADGQRALIASGVVVGLQFALFLLIGSMLWIFYRGASPDALGLSTGDELFPTFIVDELPAGVAGLLIAAILAAAMSSSLNSLATSTVTDLYQRIARRELSDDAALRHARVWTLVWGLLLFGVASLFTGSDNPVVELGLGITGYTYGALLGAFLLGLLVRRAGQADAAIAFTVTVAVMAWVILVPVFGADAAPLAFPWYTPLGVAITLLVGGVTSLRGHATRQTATAAR